MANYRQTNHNGRVSAKSGSVYNRNHNDRMFDLDHAENINADMTKYNINIQYDAHNNATTIAANDATQKSNDKHEQELYAELFSDSLNAQNKRNVAGGHAIRNKNIKDLLDSPLTCPEETVFQLGSLEDGYPDPEILMSIFHDFQAELINQYGDNLHFTDASLHMDEAVPHIHIRKVWTYHGKDGLDISQNKALTEMGFERPNPDKPPNKWNNAKTTFTAYERELKLRICEEHGLEVEHTPKHPGKASMEKEEAIALKLQAKNQEYREETDRLIDERENTLSSLDADIDKKQKKLDKVSADLITEETKNREVSDTNFFGKPKMITLTPQEYRSLLKSAETRESNDYARFEIETARKENDETEQRLLKFQKQLDRREKNIAATVQKAVEKGIQEQMPEAIRTAEQNNALEAHNLSRERKALDQREARQDERENDLDIRESNIAKQEHSNSVKAKALHTRELELEEKDSNMDAEIRYRVSEIIRTKFTEFFSKFLQPIFKRFKGSHQDEVLNVLDQMPIDHTSAQKLLKLGYPNLEGRPYEDALDLAEQKDIYDLLKKRDPDIDLDDISEEEYDNMIDAIRKGSSVEDATKKLAEDLAEKYVPVVRRRGGR